MARPRLSAATLNANAARMAATIRANGVTIERLDPRAGFITLLKRFPAGDKAAYTTAESDCGILYDIPAGEPGSVWGTDGGSIGGMVGLNGGYMRLNRSGCSKRFLAALATHAACG